jgi:hypothetical protein
MAIDSTTPASRRVLLAGTVGGLAALAAHALGRPIATNASTAVLLGENNTSNSTTKITNPNGAGTALAGYVTGSGTALVGESDSGTGVYGTSSFMGVKGTSTSGYAVFGYSKSGYGVAGTTVSGKGVIGSSASGNGVYGETSSSAAGMRGNSESGVGVYGASGFGAPGVKLKAGVYGWGPATTGLAPSYGVIGKSASALGIGVLGSCDEGTGVSAASKTGRALNVAGRVEFKTSGIATIGAGATDQIVDPGVPIKVGTRILVTLLGSAGGTTVLSHVAKDLSDNTFKVVLTGPSVRACSFSWFVIG